MSEGSRYEFRDINVALTLALSLRERARSNAAFSCPLSFNAEKPETS